MKVSKLVLLMVVGICVLAVTAQAETIVGTFVPVTGNSTSAVNPWSEASSNPNNDNLWFYTGAADDTYLAYLQEDSPMFTTTVTGLDAGHAYAISIITMAGNSDWGVQACQAGGTLTSYGIMSPGAVNTGRFGNTPPEVDYYQIPVFQVSGVTEASMDIDDLTSAHARVWGIAYEDIGAVPEPGTLVMLMWALASLAFFGLRKR